MQSVVLHEEHADVKGLGVIRLSSTGTGWVCARDDREQPISVFEAASLIGDEGVAWLLERSERQAALLDVSARHATRDGRDLDALVIEVAAEILQHESGELRREHCV